MDRRTFMANAAVAALAPQAFAKSGRDLDMADFPIVDTHVHFWNPARLRYPWLDNSNLLNKPYLPSDYAQAAAGVNIGQLVFVQAACLPEQALDEVAFISELAAACPTIAAIVADAPLENGDMARPMLEILAANKRVRGIRRMLQGETSDFCLGDGFVQGVKALSDYGLSCDLGVNRHQLKAAAELARRCPEVRFMLNHIGAPDIRNRVREPWSSEITALAALPNVYCKISGAPTLAAHDTWTADDLTPYLDHVFEAFGPERTAYGSDWPVMLLATTYTRWVETVMAATRDFTSLERRQVFSDTACVFYKLER